MERFVNTELFPRICNQKGFHGFLKGNFERNLRKDNVCLVKGCVGRIRMLCGCCGTVISTSNWETHFDGTYCWDANERLNREKGNNHFSNPYERVLKKRRDAERDGLILKSSCISKVIYEEKRKINKVDPRSGTVEGDEEEEGVIPPTIEQEEVDDQKEEVTVDQRKGFEPIQEMSDEEDFPQDYTTQTPITRQSSYTRTLQNEEEIGLCDDGFEPSGPPEEVVDEDEPVQSSETPISRKDVRNLKFLDFGKLLVALGEKLEIRLQSCLEEILRVSDINITQEMLEREMKFLSFEKMYELESIRQDERMEEYEQYFSLCEEFFDTQIDNEDALRVYVKGTRGVDYERFEKLLRMNEIKEENDSIQKKLNDFL